MPVGWRRITEQFRQTTAMAIQTVSTIVPVVELDKNDDTKFRPTSNARNVAMLDEAAKFATHIRKLEKDIKTMVNQIRDYYKSVNNLLLYAELPRVYVSDGSGGAIAEKDPETIGQDFCTDMGKAGSKLNEEIEEDVLKPIQEWMNDYHKAQRLMKELEKKRLELDSRRRDHDNLIEWNKKVSAKKDLRERKVLQKSATVKRDQNAYDGEPCYDDGSDYEDKKLGKLIEQINKLQEKKDKGGTKELGCKAAFEEKEVEVFQFLSDLIFHSRDIRRIVKISFRDLVANLFEVHGGLQGHEDEETYVEDEVENSQVEAQSQGGFVQQHQSYKPTQQSPKQLEAPEGNMGKGHLVKRLSGTPSHYQEQDSGISDQMYSPFSTTAQPTKPGRSHALPSALSHGLELLPRCQPQPGHGYMGQPVYDAPYGMPPPYSQMGNMYGGQMANMYGGQMGNMYPHHGHLPPSPTHAQKLYHPGM